MIKIAVLYARANEEEHYTNSNNADYQIFVLERYCEQNNIAVLKRFIDIHPGNNFDRPGWANLMEYVQNYSEHINYVLFTDRERFRGWGKGTDVKESNDLIAWLMALEIEPKPLIDPYFLESNTPEEMQNFFNSYKNLHP